MCFKYRQFYFKYRQFYIKYRHLYIKYMFFYINMCLLMYVIRVSAGDAGFLVRDKGVLGDYFLSVVEFILPVFGF